MPHDAETRQHLGRLFAVGFPPSQFALPIFFAKILEMKRVETLQCLEMLLPNSNNNFIGPINNSVCYHELHTELLLDNFVDFVMIYVCICYAWFVCLLKNK